MALEEDGSFRRFLTCPQVGRVREGKAKARSTEEEDKCNHRENENQDLENQGLEQKRGILIKDTQFEVLF